jgi:hypothetical protein
MPASSRLGELGGSDDDPGRGERDPRLGLSFMPVLVRQRHASW